MSPSITIKLYQYISRFSSIIHEVLGFYYWAQPCSLRYPEYSHFHSVMSPCKAAPMMTRKAVIPERIHGLMALWALAVLRIERDPEPVFQEGDKFLASDVETHSSHGDAV